MRNTVELLGVPFDKITMREAVRRVEEFAVGNRAHAIFTPNAEIVMAAQRDPELMKILRSADMLIADGAGIILGSKLLGLGLPEKVSGIDLMRNLFKESEAKKYKFFFLGSRPGVAEAARENIIKEYPDAAIVGCYHGFFKPEEEEQIITDINSSGANILLVAFGVPLQEKWICRNKHRLNVKVCAGVGGSLDVFAGKVKPAPEFMRKAGLEWLFRLCCEPRRYKRMLDLPRFVSTVLKVKFGIIK